MQPNDFPHSVASIEKDDIIWNSDLYTGYVCVMQREGNCMRKLVETSKKNVFVMV